MTVVYIIINEYRNNFIRIWNMPFDRQSQISENNIIHNIILELYF